MKILLTNDDGVQSEGLHALRGALEREHEVWVVAPDVERSGTSHGITLRDGVRILQMGEKLYACGGTPADCVLYSLLGAVPFEPDVVVSGINHGPNIGTDIIYSGTAAAARQAALMKKPGIAVSVVADGRGLRFDQAAQFIADNIETLASLWSDDHFVNINVPATLDVEATVEITEPARRIYRDHLEDFVAPNGDTYYFLKGSLNDAFVTAGTDWHAVVRNAISISPIYLHPVKDTCGGYTAAQFKGPRVPDSQR